MLFHYLKYGHLLAALFAVGVNTSYGVWVARARREPEHLGFALGGIQWLDRWIATPMYLLLLLTGVGMCHAAHLPLRTPWILASLALLVTLMALGLFGYGPTLRAELEVLAAEGPQSPAFRRLASRGRLLGGLMSVLVLVIVGMMLFKPVSG